MKLYSVYIKSEYIKSPEEVFFVRNGVTWFAPLFNVFWALYNKMWLLTVILLFFKLSLYILNINHLISPGLYFVIKFSFFLILLIFGNDIKEYFLKRKGLNFTTITCGKNLLDAKRRFFKEYF